ncbi:MAG TPA: N-6 DNA methylase [Verrucomicrobiae bacterium]
MSTGSAFEYFERELNRLVESFGQRLAELKKPSYAEAQLRDDFLNPFFRALGWDMENRAGLIQQKREVEIESRTQIGGRRKRADYLFRSDGRDRFVCEAKKPAEELGSRYAFQAKRYAWNKDLPLAVLTDFEEMKIYIVGGKPYADEPQVGEWKSWHFRQYPLIARDLWDLLAREKVAAGSIDQLLESLPKRPTGKGKARQQWLIKPDRSRALDTDFLEFLDETRRELASDLYKNNDHAELLEGNKLNEAVQRILDRILFLRICEDRDIDTGELLQSIVGKWRKNTGQEDDGQRAHQCPLELREEPPADYGVSGIRAPKDSLWRAVVRHFRALDRRPPTHVPFFNGNLFKPHFSETLIVGDEWLAGFISDLSDDETPYLFNVIPVEILGSVYERFLGNVVRPQGKGITVEPKPEVRKAGGVYYTPRYIVDYIVEQTVGKLLDGIAAEKEEEGVKAFAARTEKLRLLDPACGSGSFLIRAFERVCEHSQRRLTADLPPKEQQAERATWEKKHRPLCWVDADTGDVHLTVALKRQVLTQNIYGVDLDSAAVEVTQLSLYLKMLENENRTTLERERDLFPDAVALLPPLQDNIKCGNSLIASDFSMMPEDLVRVHAFDWPVQFAAIMKAGGFDAVIGNPPYIRIQGFPEDQIAYFGDTYRAATGNYDIYVNFVERGLNLLSKTGRLGMILPNKFFRTDYGAGLRSSLAEKGAVAEIVDFGAEQVFEATTYTCLLFLTRDHSESFKYATSKANEKTLRALEFEQRISDSLTGHAWTFADKAQSRLLEKLKSASVRLLDLPADMSRGSSSGDDDIFVVAANGHGLEKDILRTPLFAADFGRYLFAPQDKWRIIFPYAAGKDGFCLMTSSELHKKFPKTFAHLQQNAGRLRERKQFKEWFGYSAARNLELHDRAQIAVPLLADGGLFALIPKSSRGSLCPMASGGFTITLGAECAVKPEFVLGILNSKLSFWFLRQISNVFRGGWITCTKQYFGELPIVGLDLRESADKARHDKLVGLVDKMLVLMPKLRAAMSDSEKATLQNAVTATDQQIDQLVYEFYGLTSEEIALVEGP